MVSGYERKNDPQEREIYDQRGESAVAELIDLTANELSLIPWYSSEGVGTGWYYSVLGGGIEARPPVALSKRIPVSFDNTNKEIAKGDFVVPTVFNGNFDTISKQNKAQPLPGWSFHNSFSDTLQSHLIDWTETPSLSDPRTLEEKTGYNFLSNIPTEIQDVIEKRKVGDIKAKLNVLDTPLASLMTATDEELFSSRITTSSPLGTFNNISIGHSGAPNQIHTSTDQTAFSMSAFEISISKNSAVQTPNVGSAKTTTRGINPVQVASSQISVGEASCINGSSTQTGIPNDCFIQNTISQKNSSHVGSSQIGSHQVNLIKIGSSQVDISQNHTVKIDNASSIFGGADIFNQLNPSKVTLPSLVSSQQFISSDFPSHNFTSNLIFSLNQIATNIWCNLLKPETSFDIDFQIQDLSQGQLAETQITKFDSQGRPIGGNILIDPDANGKGWFIDFTPFDNNEFNTVLSDTAYRATPDSAAFGH